MRKGGHELLRPPSRQLLVPRRCPAPARARRLPRPGSARGKRLGRPAGRRATPRNLVPTRPPPRPARLPITWTRGHGEGEEGRGRERRWRWGKPGGRPKPSYRRGAGSLRAKREVCGDNEKSACRDGKMAEKATACYRGEDPPVAAPPFSLKTGRAKFILSGNTPGHRGARLTTTKQTGTAQGEERGHELHRPPSRQQLVPRR